MEQINSPCAVCGTACRFASTSIVDLAELADLGDGPARLHLVQAGAGGDVLAMQVTGYVVFPAVLDPMRGSETIANA